MLEKSANEYQVKRAVLLRQVLPFDEETSSRDQSMINRHKRDSVSGQQKAALDNTVLDQLNRLAVSVRGLIRVKMADESDLKQAESAIRQLNNTCQLIDAIASKYGKNISSVIEALEKL